MPETEICTNSSESADFRLRRQNWCENSHECWPYTNSGLREELLVNLSFRLLFWPVAAAPLSISENSL